MPLFHYKCQKCKTGVRRICKPTEAEAQSCFECGSKLKRDPHPPSAQVMETLDNGAMPKRVERLADSERLFRDRSKTPR